LLADIRTLMISIDESAGGWLAGVSARRDMALLLMGFAGAHRRSELVALTLADVTLHATDGLHVRLRRSKTDQVARGTVKALPYGRDPVTCPPCAYARWRQILLAWDTAADGAGRRAVLPILRRQATLTTTATGGGEEEPVLHCCRSTPAPRVTGSGPGVVPDGAQDRRDRRPGDVRGRDRRDDPAPRGLRVVGEFTSAVRFVALAPARRRGYGGMRFVRHGRGESGAPDPGRRVE